ncbi:unnamed protein product [Brassica oleracea]|uniref:(rape) hypothetical protein n=1 Tax=Brassica napus TaxID=3708 RepID=A0A816I068_BRANA|nr:unnamed protein product [Brassica napus]
MMDGVTCVLINLKIITSQLLFPTYFLQKELIMFDSNDLLTL